MDEQGAPIGGAFLIEQTEPEQVFTPEELSSDARLMAKTMEEFVRKEVLPVRERLEAHEEGLMRRLLQQAGQLGLLAAGVPEAYEGLNLPKPEAALLAEKAALDLSFAISAGVHAGVALLPLLYFGTTEQKRRYLPGLASGELLGAFALSEADSGSDALSARTRAVLSPGGSHYLLNGAKMWITNGGFADLFTVFAQVDGERFTAFLVEGATPGLVRGREEHKLGLHGSSTRRILLEDARVPVENVLGEVGKGHRPALYALNLGRFNIAATALGACKEVLKTATLYAKQRVQFGQPIADFGLIRHKLAEMAIRIYLLESMVYRTAGYLETRFRPIQPDGPDSTAHYCSASEEYAMECALLKFFGTEVLDYVVDEALQIHGGFGFSEEFPMARAYRDARVFRIFEGTNEINRLTVFDQIRRRAEQGRLDLARGRDRVDRNRTSFFEDRVRDWIPNLRLGLLDAIKAVYRATLENREGFQEARAAVADMVAALYALESGWLRWRKNPFGAAGSAGMALRVYCSAIGPRAVQWLGYALLSLPKLPDHENDNDAVKSLLSPPTLDTASLRREVAAVVLEHDGYPW